jgi:Predicted DNA-binding proteins
MPLSYGFEPIRQNGAIHDDVLLNIDEYEVIRLVDFEKLTQEQCAVQMGVSRTTITGIYDGARFKIADALINDKKLVIDGGDFILCEHNRECCGKGCKHKCFDVDKMHCDKECCHKVNENFKER